MIFENGRVLASSRSLKNQDVVMWQHTICIDTREQQPFTMQGVNTTNPPPDPFKFTDFKVKKDSIEVPLCIPTCISSLQTGDYSIRGLEHEIAVERKSLEDLFGTLGEGRERFENELDRLNEMRGFVVVEAPWPVVMSGLANRRLSPQSVYGSIIAYQQRYPRVHWWMCVDRRDAETTTFRILRYYAEGISVT